MPSPSTASIARARSTLEGILNSGPDKLDNQRIEDFLNSKAAEPLAGRLSEVIDVVLVAWTEWRRHPCTSSSLNDSSVGTPSQWVEPVAGDASARAVPVSEGSASSLIEDTVEIRQPQVADSGAVGISSASTETTEVSHVAVELTAPGQIKNSTYEGVHFNIEITPGVDGNLGADGRPAFRPVVPAPPVQETQSIERLDCDFASSDPPRSPVQNVPSPVTPAIPPGSAALQPTLRPGQIPPPGMMQVPPQSFRSIKIDLPNGKVGEKYDALVRAQVPGGNDLVVDRISVPDGCGLEYDRGSGRLRGVPVRPGDVDICLYCRPSDFPPGRSAEKISVKLIVNPDPRSLWRSMEFDRTLPFVKESEKCVKFGLPENRSMVAASKRGRSHAHKGDFREDDFELRHDDSSGWTVLAVADGAGSARFSRRGSQIAVETSVRTALLQLGGAPGRNLTSIVNRIQEDDAQRKLSGVVYEVLGHAAYESVRMIEAEAQVNGCLPRDFATTLLLAAWRHVPDVGHIFLSFWCGDGAIGLYDRDGDVHLLGEPDGGEFAGQTRFLDRTIVANSADLVRRLRVKVVPSFTALALMTDGVSDPKFETETNLTQRRLWDGLWEELSPCLDKSQPDRVLLDWLDFWSPGNHDDRTLALLW
jgi:hypothetical protein